MRNDWSATERAMLAEMWLCGVSIPDMSKVLTRTTGAIGARLSLQGLVGRKGKGLLSDDNVDDITAAIDAGMDDYAIPDEGAHDAVARALLAMVACGRGDHRIAAASRVDPKTVRRVDAILFGSGTWAKSGPPIAWWLGGVDRLRATIGQIARQVEKIEETSRAA